MLTDRGRDVLAEHRAGKQAAATRAVPHLTRDEGTLQAEGRIVLMTPHGSALKLEMVLDNLAAPIDEGKLTRFAIAKPERAPHGLRAMEARHCRGQRGKIQPDLVLGENVAQTAQSALSGNAEGGIIALSLARALEVAAQGGVALIPQDWHEPRVQRMVLPKNAGPVAEEFYACVQSPKVRVIMVEYGFVLHDGG